MNIKFNDLFIQFTENEIIEHLEKNGFKIETHKIFYLEDCKIDKLIAIPLNEEYDSKKHKSIEFTFGELIRNKIKSMFLNL